MRTVCIFVNLLLNLSIALYIMLRVVLPCKKVNLIFSLFCLILLLLWAILPLIFAFYKRQKLPWYRCARVSSSSYSCIEVNKKKQELHCFIDGKLLIKSPCVTGTKGKKDTPCGTFHIYLIRNDFYIQKKIYKNSRHVRHAFFFLPWHEGFGIHDASWTGKEVDYFKSDTYLTNGSLGCVQVPLDVSEKLFENIYLGMPVIINEK